MWPQPAGVSGALTTGWGKQLWPQPAGVSGALATGWGEHVSVYRTLVLKEELQTTNHLLRHTLECLQKVFIPLDLFHILLSQPELKRDEIYVLTHLNTIPYNDKGIACFNFFCNCIGNTEINNTCKSMWTLLQISGFGNFSHRCVKSSPPPCNLHRQTLDVERPFWSDLWLSMRHLHRKPPFQQVSSSNFCPARAAPVNCKCCYCEAEMSWSNNSSAVKW